MTSQINFSSIDTAYPVAGQDNNSQGFRDNFTAIAAALSTAKTELTEIQTKAVLTQSLGGATAVANNLLGSTLSNGLYKQFNGVVRQTSGVTTITDIDLNNGPLQVFTLNASATLRFNNWPTDAYGRVRVHLRGNGAGVWTPTLSTSNGGSIIYATGFPAITLGINQKHKVVEAWSYDAGATVYVQYIGEF